MRKLIVSVGLAMSLAMPVMASEGGGHAQAMVDIDHGSIPSLQRGARLFHNYCLSCHSVQYMRYQRVGKDLKIPDDLLKQGLMFASDKPGETMTVALRSDDGNAWFGKAPPDLTLTARQRGEAWVYNYLKSFYLDPSRPTGSNNLVLQNASMPHVLWPLQGWQRAVFEDTKDANGESHKVFKKFELVQQGAMSPEEYDRAVKDITNYMGYLAEPVRLDRQRVGLKVLIFLAFLGVLAYLLKQEYWKDVH